MSLILGGAGYIGENLVRKVEDPIIYDIKFGNDILDYDLICKSMKEANVCYHLAAISGRKACSDKPNLALRTNVEGTHNVLRAAQKYGVKVVFTSSIAAVSLADYYGYTKKMGELLCEHFEAIIFRCSNVYGGYRYLEKKDTVISKFVKNDVLTIHGDGLQVRDFVHVDDVTDLLLKTHDHETGTYNICTGEMTSIIDLAETILSLKGKGDIVYEERKTVNSPRLNPSFKSKIRLEKGLKKLIR